MTESGLGYEIRVPANLLDRLPATGDPVELHTALVVRDDALELYGFGSGRDRTLFLRLQKASGVGPALARSVLGALPGDRVIRAIRAKDHEVLETVSGVGRKTAERIALELADKLDDLEAEVAADESASAGTAAVRALRALGYGARESEEAVFQARTAGDGDGAGAEDEVGTEELVRRALQHI